MLCHQAILSDALERIFQSSSFLSDVAVLNLLQALRRQLDLDAAVFEDDDPSGNPVAHPRRNRRKRRASEQRHRHPDKTDSSSTRPQNADASRSEIRSDVRARVRQMAMSALGAADASCSHDSNAGVNTTAICDDISPQHTHIEGATPTPTVPMTVDLGDGWYDQHAPFSVHAMLEIVRHNTFRLHLIWGQCVREFLLALAGGLDGLALHSIVPEASHTSTHNGATGSGAGAAYLLARQAAHLRSVAVEALSDITLDALAFTNDKIPRSTQRRSSLGSDAVPSKHGSASHLDFDPRAHLDPRLLQSTLLRTFSLFLDETDCDYGSFNHSTTDGAAASDSMAVCIFQAVLKIITSGGHLMLDAAWHEALQLLARACVRNKPFSLRHISLPLAKPSPVAVSVAFKAMSLVVDDCLTYVSH